MSAPQPDYTALILAGGRATRMNGIDKGLALLDSRPLIAHTLAALAAQTLPPARILISANRNLDAYAAYGHPVLPDAEPDFPGPLAGVLAGIARQGEAPLLILPCDAVRLPGHFAAQLLAALQEHDAASAEDAAHWHPTLLALRPGLEAALQAYLASGQRSIRGWLDSLSHRRVAFDGVFPNLNTPEALAALQSG